MRRGRWGRNDPDAGSGRVPRAVAVVGATATGKTAVAVEVARRLAGEIISVDSRQAYRGLDIGTAAPTPSERAAVPHHGVAFLDPAERYGAGRFARLARAWAREVEGRGSVPILAGGTGLFLRALLRPVFREPPLDPDRRERLRRWLEARPAAVLTGWAGRLDAALARRLPRLDPQRAGRAIEVALLTGRPLSEWQSARPAEGEPVAARVFALELPAPEHRRRIEERTSRLLEAGWPEEVRALLAAGHEGSPALDAVGYRHVVALVRGRLSRDEALAAIVRDTWGYARRQRTWFRHQLPADAVRLDARRPVDQLARRIVGEGAPLGASEPDGTGGRG